MKQSLKFTENTFKRRMITNPNILIVGCSDGCLRVLDMKKRKILLTRRNSESGGVDKSKSSLQGWISDVEVLYEESVLVSSGTGELFYFPYLNSEEPPDVWKGHTGRVEDILFINRHLFFTSSWDKSIGLWDVRKKKIIERSEGVHSTNIWGIDKEMKRNWLISTSYDMKFKIHEIEYFPNCVKTKDLSSECGCIYDCCVDEERDILFVSCDLCLQIYSFKDSCQKQIMKIACNSSTGGLSCIFNEKKNLVVTGNYSGYLNFFDIRKLNTTNGGTNTLKSISTNGNDNIYRLCKISDERFVSSGNCTCIVDYDGTILDSFSFPENKSANGRNSKPSSVGMWNKYSQEFGMSFIDPLQKKDELERVEYCLDMMTDYEEGNYKPYIITVKILGQNDVFKISKILLNMY